MVRRSGKFCGSTWLIAGGGWLALALLAISVRASGDDAKPVLLQLQWRPQAQFAGYIVAKEKGFFAEEGAPNVELRWYREGDPPMKLVADGKVDFCTGWLSQAIKLRAEGVKIVNVGQIMQESTLMLVAWRRLGIVKPQDMTGRNVGLWGADFDVPALALFKKFGVHPNIVPQSYSITPFLRRAVHVASAMYYNEYHKLMEAGVQAEEIQTFFYPDYGLNFPEDGLYCTDATRLGRAKVCSAVVSASIKGWAYAAKNEVETLDLVMEYCKGAQLATNRNHQRWMLRTVLSSIQHRVGPDPARWGALLKEDYENVAKALCDLRFIRVSPPFDDLYKPAFGARGTP